MFERTGDPISDFNAWDAAQADALDRLPKCSECKYPINDEHLYAFGDKLICKQCLKDNHRKDTGDYVD